MFRPRSFQIFCEEYPVNKIKCVSDFAIIWRIAIDQYRREISEKYEEDEYRFYDEQTWDEYDELHAFEVEYEQDALSRHSLILPLIHSMIDDYYD